MIYLEYFTNNCYVAGPLQSDIFSCKLLTCSYFSVVYKRCGASFKPGPFKLRDARKSSSLFRIPSSSLADSWCSYGLDWVRPSGPFSLWHAFQWSAHWQDQPGPTHSTRHTRQERGIMRERNSRHWWTTLKVHLSVYHFLTFCANWFGHISRQALLFGMTFFEAGLWIHI